MLRKHVFDWRIDRIYPFEKLLNWYEHIFLFFHENKFDNFIQLFSLCTFIILSIKLSSSLNLSIFSPVRFVSWSVFFLWKALLKKKNWKDKPSFRVLIKLLKAKKILPEIFLKMRIINQKIFGQKKPFSKVFRLPGEYFFWLSSD